MQAYRISSPIDKNHGWNQFVLAFSCESPLFLTLFGLKAKRRTHSPGQDPYVRYRCWRLSTFIYIYQHLYTFINIYLHLSTLIHIYQHIYVHLCTFIQSCAPFPHPPSGCAVIRHPACKTTPVPPGHIQESTI